MSLWVSTIALISVLSTVVVCQTTKDPESQDSPSTTNEIPDIKKRILLRRSVWVTEYHFTPAEKLLLAPSELDRLLATPALTLPATSLVRLYPWAKRRQIVSVDDLADGRSPEFSSHACTYSFSKERHGSGLNGYVDPRLGWAELKLGDGKFFTGFTGESLGVLVALGDVPLEMVTPESDGVKGLTNIIPPTDYFEASSLSRRNRGGFEMDRYSYGSSLPVVSHRTYVLRTTSNRRADLLVGFRVISTRPDGSVTILWRKLKSYPKPTWKRREIVDE